MILSVFDCSLSYISTQVLLLKLKHTDLASFAGQFVLGILLIPVSLNPGIVGLPGICVGAECPSSVFHTCTGNSLQFTHGAIALAP